MLPTSAYAFDYPSAPVPQRTAPTTAQLEAAAAAAAERSQAEPLRPHLADVRSSRRERQGRVHHAAPSRRQGCDLDLQPRLDHRRRRQVGLSGLSRRPQPGQDRQRQGHEPLRGQRRVIDASAHAQTLCTDCHVDFAYKTPHPNTVASDEWKILAKSACKNCHRDKFLEWANSAHSTAGSPSPTGTADVTTTVGAPDSSAPGKPRPLCGDCHGGHAIPSKTDTAAAEVIHGSALEMCGQCHTKAASTYADYYHGAAYRRGAEDAPACWQCHNTHLILPSANRLSWTNQDNLVTTCGQCHKGTLNDQYTDYARLDSSQGSDTAGEPGLCGRQLCQAGDQQRVLPGWTGLPQRAGHRSWGLTGPPQGEKGLHSMSLQKRARARRLTIALRRWRSRLLSRSPRRRSRRIRIRNRRPPMCCSSSRTRPCTRGSARRCATRTSPTTKNYANEIKFSHGNHILMQCSDCHPRFPHRQSGTEKPDDEGLLQLPRSAARAQGRPRQGRVRGLPQHPALAASSRVAYR